MSSSGTDKPEGVPPASGDADAAAAAAVDGASSGGGTGAADAADSAPIGDLYHHMAMHRRADVGSGDDSHKFWDKQPVPKLAESSTDNEPIEIKTVDDVRKKPYKLPTGYSWSVVDVNKPEQLTELYDLLAQNYVEDSDAMFRFDYKPEFLKWALSPPGGFGDWILGVRFDSTGEMCAFISGIPVHACIKGKTMTMCEINFLCVHKDLRSKRLAPLLIKEVTRRVNKRDIWQAVYTAGVVVPSPVAGCQYHHRTINCRKLLDIGFTRLGKRMTKIRYERLHRLPEKPTIPGWRKMTKADIPAVTKLVNAYVSRFDLHLRFCDAEIRHWLLPRDGVVSAYVVVRADEGSSGESAESESESTSESASASASASASSAAGEGDATAASTTTEGAEAGVEEKPVTWDPAMTATNAKGAEILAVASFYHLPSSVLRNAKHSDLRAAYSYYNVPGGGIDMTELMRNLLIAARDEGMDVFNALKLMDNEVFFGPLRFGPGDGTLHYYLYNWKCAKLPPGQVGIVLL